MAIRIAKQEKSRRGILFTVSVLLLCVALIMMAMVLSSDSAKSRRIATALVDFDRTADAYSNIEDGLAQISVLRMNISVKNGTVLLNETIPAAADVTPYLERFALFEQNLSDLNVSVGTGSIAAGSFTVMPIGAALAHPERGFSLTPPSAESGGNLSSYDIELIFPTATLDNAQWEPLANSTGPSSLQVHVRVRDTRYAQFFDFEETLDRGSESFLNITQGGVTVATVRFLPPSALQVWSAEDIGLKASISFSVPVYVETNDVISVVSAVNRTGKLRIA